MKRIITGPRAVGEALSGRAGDLNVVFVVQKPRGALAALAKEASKRGVRVEWRAAAELDALAKGHKHQGVVAVGGAYPYAELDAVLDAAGPCPLLIGLDQITDPHNFGAIVRSAVVFGADGVLTLKNRAAPVTPVVVRASAGATEHARIVRLTNLARTAAAMAKEGVSVVGLAAEGEVSISELPPAPAGRLLIVGAEGAGLRRLVREKCTVLARIDQVGPVASLNASVAASLALYEAARQR
ncbi:MAG: 23S rRNA (guanosine(2251)-2'-O)-methyltransferase RlmB [Sandaracinaceae bacterium]